MSINFEDQSQNINTINLYKDLHDQLLLSIGDGDPCLTV